jgi:hypothetical protein
MAIAVVGGLIWTIQAAEVVGENRTTPPTLPWSWIWDSALPLVVVVAVPFLVVVGVFVGEVIKAWQSGPDPRNAPQVSQDR